MKFDVHTELSGLSLYGTEELLTQLTLSSQPDASMRLPVAAGRPGLLDSVDVWS